MGQGLTGGGSLSLRSRRETRVLTALACHRGGGWLLPLSVHPHYGSRRGPHNARTDHIPAPIGGDTPAPAPPPRKLIAFIRPRPFDKAADQAPVEGVNPTNLSAVSALSTTTVVTTRSEPPLAYLEQLDASPAFHEPAEHQAHD